MMYCGSIDSSSSITRYNKSTTRGILIVLLFVVTLLGLTNNSYIVVQGQFTFNENNYNKKWNDETEIWFGQSTALTGQTKELGYPMMTGVQAAFKEINDLGGVWGGKKLRLFTLDDGYDPPRTLNNTIDLINNNTIFGLIGYMGTATSQIAYPWIVQSKLPFIGAFTGGLFLRSPFQPNIINIRASYQDETLAMVDYLINVKLVRRIAIFYQNDAFGLSGVSGSSLGLQALGLSFVSMGSYERNTIEVSKAVNDIQKGNPQAIICMSTYLPTVTFVNAVKNRTDFDPNIVFMTGSFIGSNQLPYRDSFMITQILPPPTNTKYASVLAYQRAKKAIDPNFTPSYVEFEGYMAGKLAYNILTQRVSGDLTRSNFISLLYSSGTYIIDNTVVGPYTQCAGSSSARKVHVLETDPFGQQLLVPESVTKPKFSPRVSFTPLTPREVVGFTPLCSCNQGLRTVYKTYQKEDKSFVEISAPTVWDSSGSTNYTCLYDPSNVHEPIVFGHVNIGSQHDIDFLVGAMAAVQEKNNQKGIRGRVVQLLSVTQTNVTATSIINTVKNLIKDHNVLGVIGSYIPLSEITQFIIGMRQTLPDAFMLAPYSSYDSMKFRETYAPNIINVGTMVRERLATFFNYEMNTNGHSRFSIVYTKSESGLGVYSEFKSMIRDLKLEIDSEYSFYIGDNLNADLIAATLSNHANPQAVLLAIPDIPDSFDIYKTLIDSVARIQKRDEISLCIIYWDSISWEHNLATFMKSLRSSTTLKFNIVQRFPLVSANHPLVAAYNNFMSTFQPNTQVKTKAAIEGFLTMSFLFEVLDNIAPSLPITGANILQTMYTNGDFLKYTIPFGTLKKLSIDSGCNLAMRSSYVYTFDNQTSSFSLARTHSFDKANCGIDSLSKETSFSQPIIFGRLLPNVDNADNDFEYGVTSMFTSVKDKGTLSQTTLHVYTEYYSDEDDMLEKATSMINKNKVFGFLGSRILYNEAKLKALLEEKRVLLIGPLSSQKALREPYSRFVVNIRPSIVEEVVTMARYIKQKSQGSKPSISIVYGNGSYWEQNKNDVLDFFETSLEGVSIGSVQKIFSTTNTRQRRSTYQDFSSLSFNLVIILADAQDTLSYLNQLPESNSAVLYGVPSEISSTALFSQNIKNSAMSQLLTSNFLDKYSSASNTNFMARDFLQYFTQYYPTKNTSMLAYEGFTIGYMAVSVMQYMKQANMPITNELFVNTLFERSIFELGTNVFGPYGDLCTSTFTNASSVTVSTVCETQKSCNCSQGAKSIFLSIPLRDESFKVSFETCGLQPILPLLSNAAIAGIVVAGTFTAIGICCLVMIGIICSKKSSGTKHAPKSGYITCAFTDIQNSTKLWQHDEKTMRASLEIHDQIMRKNLELYRGYEVKTNGDSFFVAFKSPHDAVLWAMQVQIDLLNAKWPSELYHQWDCRQKWDKRTKRAYWSGVRVRIGLHFGKGDAKWDKTMKRFDYFGNVVNKAARIEAIAHGGQVLISDELLQETADLFNDIKYMDEQYGFQQQTAFQNKLKEKPEMKRRDSVASSIQSLQISSLFKKVPKVNAETNLTARELGLFQLKGLLEESRVFEIKCAEIAMRQYPPLRVSQDEQLTEMPHMMNEFTEEEEEDGDQSVITDGNTKEVE